MAKKLDVNLQKNYFDHPDDPSRKIFWIYDIIHILKNIRNHLMDDDIILPGGIFVKKKQHFVQNRPKAGSALVDRRYVTVF